MRCQQLLQTIWLEFDKIWLTGMVLIWPSQILDEIVYLDHMGKNRFSKTLKISLSETTRLIALIFCVGLSSIYFSFLFKLCPWGHKLSRLWVHMFYIGRGLVCRVWLWYFLTILTCFFKNGKHEKILSETICALILNM